MKLQYSLTENDFLQYQLYTSSKNKSRTKQILLLVVVVILINAYYCYRLITEGNFSFLFLVWTAILLVLIPIYMRWRFINHFKNFIKKNYKERIGIVSEINFKENDVEISSPIASTNIYNDSFSEFIEIKDYYFLKLKTGEGLIVPKRILNNQEGFIQHLNFLKNKYQIPQETNLQWKYGYF